MLIRVERSPEVWQSSDMMYPAVNDPNITSGFTFNKLSVSLMFELRSFVVLQPLLEQSAPSAARYNILQDAPRSSMILWCLGNILSWINFAKILARSCSGTRSYRILPRSLDILLRSCNYLARPCKILARPRMIYVFPHHSPVTLKGKVPLLGKGPAIHRFSRSSWRHQPNLCTCDLCHSHHSL